MREEKKSIWSWYVQSAKYTRLLLVFRSFNVSSICLHDVNRLKARKHRVYEAKRVREMFSKRKATNHSDVSIHS